MSLKFASATATINDLDITEVLKNKIISEILEKDEETLGIVLNFLRGHLEKTIENPDLIIYEKSKIDLLNIEIETLKKEITLLRTQFENEICNNRSLIDELRKEISNLYVRF